MRNLAQLALLSALLAACVPPGTCPDPAVPHRKVTATTVGGNQGAWVCGLKGGPVCPAVTGNNATVVVFTTTSQGDMQRGQYPGLQRVFARFRFDQATTVLYQTLDGNSTTWRTMNGSGSGDSLAANTDYAVDFLVLGPDVRVAVATGGTGPSTREESVQVFNDRALGMFQ